MSAPTLEAAVNALRARLEPVPTTSDDGPHKLRARWLEALADLPTTPRGTMRAWMQAHNGQDVDTYQWRVNSAGEPASPWAPGSRKVCARASSVELDGSSRAYAGCTVLATSDDVLVIRSTFGDDAWQVVIYRAAS